jgi:hypothetical protein
VTATGRQMAVAEAERIESLVRLARVKALLPKGNRA